MAALITFNNCVGEVEKINGESRIHFHWDRPDQPLDYVYICAAAPNGTLITQKEYCIGGFTWSASITTGVRVKCPIDNDSVGVSRYYIYGVSNQQNLNEKISEQEVYEKLHQMCCDVWIGSAHVSYKWQKKTKGNWTNYILHVDSSAEISEGAIFYRIHLPTQRDPIQYPLPQKINAGYQVFPDFYLPEDVGEPIIEVIAGAKSIIHFESKSWFGWIKERFAVKGSK